jgi:hypothetical protein
MAVLHETEFLLIMIVLAGIDCSRFIMEAVMAKIANSLVKIIALLLLAVPLRAMAQTPAPAIVRMYKPPVVAVELSGHEPLPLGVDAKEVLFASGGASGEPAVLGQIFPTQENGIYWRLVPLDKSWPGISAFRACNFPDSEAPVATLTYPSQRQEIIQGTQDNPMLTTLEPDGVGSICWDYVVGGIEEAYSGIELGQYTLTLDYSQQQLSHSWVIENPAEPFAFDTPIECPSECALEAIFMGFAPNETLTLRFYSRDNVSEKRDPYVTTRSIQTDGNGALIVQVRTTRGSGLVDITYLLNDYIKSRYLSDTRMRFTKPVVCPNALPTRIVVGQDVCILDEAQRILYSTPNGNNQSELPTDYSCLDWVTIKDGPICAAGAAWWKVHIIGRDYKLDGWIPESSGNTYWLKRICTWSCP